ncbi:uncharacterized protein LOC110985801 [Acanthaster planci]|uniref:Uncharacterized protein LOC110985801 n=1 Tax=Acanthaster planci TaxID=133434 RepID=A0A8B7ZHV9_ACAPL|nr:uncharacterized protein LOC110985801 [Acanthaster planci]
MDIQRPQLSAVFLIFSLSIFIRSTNSVQLTVTPTRRNVLIGDRADFLCSYTPDPGFSCDDTFVFWGKKGGDNIANMTYVIDSSKYGIRWQSRVNNEGFLRCLYTLIIKDITSSDGGQYSCALIRPQSGRFFISQALVKLQPVIPPPDVYPVCKTSVIAGQSLTHGMMLVCESLIGQPPVTLEWFSGDYQLPAELHKLNNNKLLHLETTMTSVDMDQIYDPVIMCVMTLPDPIDEIRTCSINTTTTVIVQSASTDQSCVQMYTFFCHVTSNIPFEINWHLNDQLIEPEDLKDRFFVETEAQALHIRNVTAQDNKSVVTCHVATMFGNFSGAAVMEIDTLDPGRKKLMTDSLMALILGLIVGSFFLLVAINIIIWYKCRRCLVSNSSVKESSMQESTPFNLVSQSESKQGKVEVVTETGFRSDSHYLDMSITVKKAAATNNAHYSPMKSLDKSNDDDYMVASNDNDDTHVSDNEYMMSSKSDDPDTYVYSSTDDLSKIKGKNNPKPAIKSKPSKLQEETDIHSPEASGTEHHSKENISKRVNEQQISPPALSDNDDTNDYEVLAKDNSSNKPKLTKITSDVNLIKTSPTSAKSSPKLTRNFSAPLLSQEQPEYAVPNDTCDMMVRSTKEAPVYDIPKDNNSPKTNNIHQRINNFEKATGKSSSPLFKKGMLPPVAQKKPNRHSDPPSSSDSEQSLKKRAARISLPQDDSTNQYLVPSVSQQNLDKINVKTPPVKESKSPLLKKVKNPFKTKNNNKDVYQCLDRQSMDIEKPDYQLLLGIRKVDDTGLYENVSNEAAV